MNLTLCLPAKSCSFYYVNVWKLWTVFFLWNFDFN